MHPGIHSGGLNRGDGQAWEMSTPSSLSVRDAASMSELNVNAPSVTQKKERHVRRAVQCEHT